MNKNTFTIVITLAGILRLVNMTEAQGWIRISNTSSEIRSPLIGPTGYLDSNYFAQIQFADGPNLGVPIPFNSNGLFKSGKINIPRVVPGESLKLIVRVSNKAHTATAQSKILSLHITGLGTTDSIVIGPNDWKQPPVMATRQSVIIPHRQPILLYRRLDQNRLELSWRGGSNLCQSVNTTDISNQLTQRPTTENGWLVITVAMRSSKQFFKLVEHR